MPRFSGVKTKAKTAFGKIIDLGTNNHSNFIKLFNVYV